jgi:HNH endonuclease
VLDKHLALRRDFAEEIEKLRKFHRKCHICMRRIKRSERLSIDHVIALAAGGQNHPSNFGPAQSCNSAKGERRFNPITGRDGCSSVALIP